MNNLFISGHTKHEMTSYACMEALFEYFENRYLEFTKGNKDREGGNEPKKSRTDL